MKHKMLAIGLMHLACTCSSFALPFKFKNFKNLLNMLLPDSTITKYVATLPQKRVRFNLDSYKKPDLKRSCNKWKNKFNSKREFANFMNLKNTSKSDVPFIRFLKFEEFQGIEKLPELSQKIFEALDTNFNLIKNLEAESLTKKAINYVNNILTSFYYMDLMLNQNYKDIDEVANSIHTLTDNTNTLIKDLSLLNKELKTNRIHKTKSELGISQEEQSVQFVLKSVKELKIHFLCLKDILNKGNSEIFIEEEIEIPESYIEEV